MRSIQPRNRIYIPILIVTNFLPLYFYATGGWTVFMFFYLYWLETVILSFYTSLKIISASGYTENEVSPSLFKKSMTAIKFFIARSLLLCFYLLFLVVFIGFMGEDKDAMFKSVLAVVFRDETFNIAVAGFILSHGFEYLFNYLLTNENKKMRADGYTLFFDARIIVIHVSIVLSAFVITWSPENQIAGHAVGSYLALAIFIVIKTIVDVFHFVSKNNKQLETHIHNKY
ncbi:hypothetical protein LBMAG27_20060 [Bacteroidota bacterium]|nr:hypothetical protein LBMAG27_20060 [Bacteroidota bacterium]